MAQITVKSIMITATAALMLLLPAQQTLARGAFDGAWTIEISGNSGDCDGQSFQYSLEINNNVLRYSGSDVHISGNVSPSGSVDVRVTNDFGNATGSGRLSGSSGRGRFHGKSANGSCNGTWSASRG